MKLDRNITTPRRGKYALIKLRQETITPDSKRTAQREGLMLTIEPGAVDFGDTNESDFFVIRLKDKYAAPALAAYALAAFHDDPEYGMEVLNLAKQAAEYPNQRQPD